MHMYLWRFKVEAYEDQWIKEEGIIYGECVSDAAINLEKWYGKDNIEYFYIEPIGEENEPYIINGSIVNTKLM